MGTCRPAALEGVPALYGSCLSEDPPLKTKQGGESIIVHTVPLALKHPVHTPLILLNIQGGVELSYHLCVLVMLELHNLINPCMLTNGNSMINGGLLQISGVLPVIPLRPSNHWVPSEDHTGVEVHMKGCLKSMIKLNPRQASWINSSFISGPSGHAFPSIVNSRNIRGYTR